MIRNDYLKRRLDTYCAALNEHMNIKKGIFRREELFDELNHLEDGDICQILTLNHSMLVIKQGADYAFYDPNDVNPNLNVGTLELKSIVDQIFSYNTSTLINEGSSGALKSKAPLWLATLSSSIITHPPESEGLESSLSVAIPQKDYFYFLAAFINVGKPHLEQVSSEGVCYGLSLALRELIVQYGSVTKASNVFYVQLQILADLQKKSVAEGVVNTFNRGGPQVLPDDKFHEVKGLFSANVIALIELFQGSQNYTFNTSSQVRRRVGSGDIYSTFPPCALPLSIAYPTADIRHRGVMSTQSAYELYHWQGLSFLEQLAVVQRMYAETQVRGHELIVDKDIIRAIARRGTKHEWLFVAKRIYSDVPLLMECINQLPAIAAMIPKENHSNREIITGLNRLPEAVFQLVQSVAVDLLAAIQKEGFIIKHGDTLMHLAAVSIRADILPILASMGEATDSVNMFDETPLLKAIKYGKDTGVISWFLRHEVDSYASETNLSKLAFMAVTYQNGYSLNALFDSGLNPDLVCSSGQSLLMHAVKQGDIACLDALLTHKASTLAVKGKKTPLELALEYNHYKVAAHLIDKGADCIVNGKEALLDVLIASSNLLKVKMLIHALSSKGLVDVTFKSNAMSQAVICDIIVGAEIRRSDGKLYPLFERAIKEKNYPIVKKIIEYPNIGFDPLQKLMKILSKYEDEYAMKLLLPILSVVKNSSGETSLMLAVATSDVAYIQMLLEAGADINSVDSMGHTALMFAVKYNYDDVLKLLIDKGADLFVASKEGDTVVSLVLKYKSGACLRSLISNMKVPMMLEMVEKEPENVLRDLVDQIYQYKGYKELAMVFSKVCDSGEIMADYLLSEYAGESKAIAIICVSYASRTNNEFLLHKFFSSDHVAELQPEDIIFLMFYSVKLGSFTLLKYLLDLSQFEQSMLAEINSNGNTVIKMTALSSEPAHKKMHALLMSGSKGRKPLAIVQEKEVSIFSNSQMYKKKLSKAEEGKLKIDKGPMGSKDK
ncbi:ankyrin repeat domain-containing protein [Candidatus Comchoanobacter bicostacola]|uniref:Ankyrin repeat domain-containing protein n=1 Tax=Candidatus Comchoanobacter bicostacola TaxID=2919598 RepID=A0ABY5DH55_9GAMM|nr:ankyrin repeat domain-containing protein [Candidatus Comchoanobacter bicostacola]UTC24103.1 ankyrin repeat domain-containing protein [Candidatus Comchoanobacter bicostacola]